MNTKFMKNLALGIVMIAGGAANADSVALMSRMKFGDYEKATYSFGYRTQSTARNGNDVDLLYGNSYCTRSVEQKTSETLDCFGVNMVTDDRSMIGDIGPVNCSIESREVRQAIEGVITEWVVPFEEARVVAGHCYITRNHDSVGTTITIFRVRTLIPGVMAVIDRIQTVLNTKPAVRP